MRGKRSSQIIGIDFIKTDIGGGVYGLYESFDGGDQWVLVAKGRKIDDMLETAKIRYSENIRMVMPHLITEMLRFEFLEDRELKKIKLWESKAVPPKLCWWKQIIKFFF